MHLRTAIIPIGVSRFSLPSPLGEGLGVRLPPPLYFPSVSDRWFGEVGWGFSVCKVTHDYLKNQHFSGYADCKFCILPCNNLIYRVFTECELTTKRRPAYLPSRQLKRRDNKEGLRRGITHIAGAIITPIINHKIITRNCNVKERDYI